MIDRYKIHKIVEYIKQFDFVFEINEVIDDLDKVLAYYDAADVDLTDDEHIFLIAELLPLAEQFEFSEAEHLSIQEDSLIAELPERKFDLRMEEIERKMLKKSRSSDLELLQKLAIA